MVQHCHSGGEAVLHFFCLLIPPVTMAAYLDNIRFIFLFSFCFPQTFLVFSVVLFMKESEKSFEDDVTLEGVVA